MHSSRGMNSLVRVAMLAAALSLAACGGGGGGGDVAGNGVGTPPPTGAGNQPPVANAGADQTVDAGAQVALSAAGSTDPDGDTLSYAWEQTEGPAVTLSATNAAAVSFAAPASASQSVLGFRVTVSDARGGSQAATLAVTVRATASAQGIGMLSAQARDPARFTVAGNKVFFTASTTTSFQSFDQLWVSDGTSAGTLLARDFAGGSVGQFTPSGNGTYFVAASALWFSDGTAAGTRMVKDITAATSENMVMLGVHGGRLYFTADDGVHGRELWTSDGTEAGTYMVFDLNPGSGDSEVRTQQADTVFWKGRLYLYAGYTDSRTGSFYAQLYSTDGTRGNLTALTNNTDFSDSVLLDYDMAVYNDKLYFTWHSRTNGRELWVTDGTVAGTRLFNDFGPGVDDSWPSDFNVVNGQLLVFAYQPGRGDQKSLYATDGTSAGTRLVSSVALGPLAQDMVQMNGRYYFPGRARGATAFTLWSTDGTPAGTWEVSSAVRPDDWGLTNKMIVLGGNKLVFQGTDGANGNEPWVSDGTAAGTLMLKNINATAGRGSYTSTVGAGWIVARGDKAYFIAAPSVDDFQLWETDGTAAGTKVIAPSDATVTTNPMGQAGFSTDVPNEVPVLLGNTLIFRGSFSSTGARPYRM